MEKLLNHHFSGIRDLTNITIEYLHDVIPKLRTAELFYRKLATERRSVCDHCNKQITIPSSIHREEDDEYDGPETCECGDDLCSDRCFNDHSLAVTHHMPGLGPITFICNKEYENFIADRLQLKQSIHDLCTYPIFSDEYRRALRREKAAFVNYMSRTDRLISRATPTLRDSPIIRAIISRRHRICYDNREVTIKMPPSHRLLALWVITKWRKSRTSFTMYIEWR